jgi:NTE family protein
MRALVLSGGGLFGAWQAGAWSVLEERFEPDLIVGASIGALNGYLIACGVSGKELVELWRDPEFRKLGDLQSNLRAMTDRYKLRRPFALTVTDILTMKPRTYRDGEITWRHLAASCAVPPVMPQIYLDGRWCTDGGLLNPLPVWAAVELGAAEIEGLHVLKTFPSAWLGVIVQGFRRVFGYQPELPAGVSVAVRSPSEKLGALRETLWGTQRDVERWLVLGARDAEEWAQKPFPL